MQVIKSYTIDNLLCEEELYTNYEKIKKERTRLEKQIALVEKQLRKYPEGKLICTRNGKYSKWYLSDGKTKQYIPKEQKEFAQKMAAKKYLANQLEDLLQEKRAIDYYLRHHKAGIGKAEQMLIDNPEYLKLLSHEFKPLSLELQEWSQTPYKKNENHPKQLKFYTSSGNKVRSKSEVLIDSVLHKYKIPFRYECRLILGETELYPDFTIRHPLTGETYLWEHFGMMDNMKYRNSTVNKLQTYISNGIIPSVHLITTYETLESPLDLETIEKIVEHYFL